LFIKKVINKKIKFNSWWSRS